VSTRLLEQVRQSERDMKPQPTLFMTDNQLKKLVNEAVSLHRALTTYSERLKALEADLIREAQHHEEDFTLTDGGGSRWTACGTDGCIARVNFPAPALVSLINNRGRDLRQDSRSRWRISRRTFRVAPLLEAHCGFSR
jgi:hypothetical protein